MIALKPRKLTLTLVTYVALALLVAGVADAHAAQDLNRRDHTQLNRMLKKRAPAPQDGAVIGAGSDPVSITSTGTSAATSVTSAATSNTVAITSSATTTTSSGTSTLTSATATSSSAVTSSTPTTSSSSSSSTSSSSSSTSSSVSSTSSSTTSSSSTTTITTTPASQTSQTLNLQGITSAADSDATTQHSVAHITLTSTSTAASNSATSNNDSSGATSTGKVAKTTITILIAIAASVGGLAIIWTIIRKWKFKPSSSFEDRMAPIDWNPAEKDTGLDIPGTHRRANSSASSFHSGSGHEENVAGRGMGGGYGAGSNDGHNIVPEHDFTAGPAHLAPVGGYADLARGPSPQPYDYARGPSPQPQMQEAGHNYDYGMPIHHQGAAPAQNMYDPNAIRY
ncbi:hypothetical protein PUNSTDRAFT_140438 [Punctularia strigosozonata HHB-11173 SS5]|uniref:uncharacterized protein n=1 Tax=Punctularia strigosozonata (strain HHB-11173) TaxID=741275 RepID=UPI000441695A|nr:uncharacterized protein PUNSTDRAFT_140438 [Punctularia strigosozonata HHB-11173 SS5]EIN14049.1 hypothetical protein PUNSTDRAFT_140438 [Punctularia strigosozonata HHB-11173 SS5]